MYSSFNPGGLGHLFVKDTYVLPFRTNTQTKTRFIPSTYKMNPYLNKEYITYLEELTGDLGKMWREGEWDMFAGQFFTEWNYAKHVVPAFAIPETWAKFRSIDPSGRAGITSCHWYALDWNGKVYCYKEHYGTGLDADQHAREIVRLSGSESYKYTVIDTAAFAKLGLGETIAEVYEREGVYDLVAASKERVMGWDSCHRYLRWNEGQGPNIVFFENCLNIIRTIPSLIHDEIHVEDANTKGEDHAPDEMRYFLQTLRDQAIPKPMNRVEKLLHEIKQAEGSFDFKYRK